MAKVTENRIAPPPPPPVVTYTIELSAEEANGLSALFYSGTANSTLDKLYLTDLQRQLRNVLGYKASDYKFIEIAKVEQ
jgi:hypothetical protein